MFLIGDNLAVWLFWLIRQFIIDLRTRSWARNTALLGEVNVERAYPKVIARYSFILDGGKYVGSLKRGFFYSQDAEEFAARLRLTPELVVRYDTRAPQRNFVRSSDEGVALHLLELQRAKTTSNIPTCVPLRLHSHSC